MRMFGGHFGKGRGSQGTRPEADSQPSSRSREEMLNDPNLIRVYDKYGQELFITREQWRDNILMGNIEKAWNKPDELYGIIVQSLHDKFVKEIVPAAEQLHRIDPVPSRGSTILGIAYMETGRLDKAEKVLSCHLKKHGADGVVMTNLAKVYSKQGHAEKSLQTLWRALEVDPNQDNGMGWYEVIHREKDGVEAGQDALRRVADIPGSWRAQLWLARAALEAGNLDAALDYYKESLANAGQPVPVDLLKQMSGDLGNNGHLNEIIEWAEPHFDVELHGLLVGNNLIKANLDLGHVEAAHAILDKLYALNRPDWRETLSYWDTELGKVRLKQAGELEQPPSIRMMSIEGPLWMRAGSPFSKLRPKKTAEAPSIGVFGSTAVTADRGDKPVTQLADGPGRMSRALPLVLCEQLHIQTNAAAQTLIPWADNAGFVLFGKPYSDEGIVEMARGQKKPLDYMLYITLNTVSSMWKLKARLLRIADGELLGEISTQTKADQPGDGVGELITKCIQLVTKWTGIKRGHSPEWYCISEGADYLLRIEQQLAVTSMNMDFLKGSQLTGERDILDGIIQHCARNPENKTARMLLVQTLRQMKKTRPDIMSEFKEKVAELQKEFPVTGEIGRLASEAIEETFES